jgi:hypothetical protein
MSGPKVVRIVTLEEAREIRRGELAKLDAAFARWEAICSRHGALADGDVKAMRTRYAEIAALGTQRLIDIQKRAKDEIQWIDADIERRLAEASRRAAEARVRDRRRATLARQLLQRPLLADDVRRDLASIAAGRPMEATRAEAVFGQALRRTSQANVDVKPTAELQALAQRLGAGQRGETIDEWLASQPTNDDAEEVRDKIDAAIAGLAVVGAESEAEALDARYKSVQSEPSPAVRKMRSDTLLLDIAKSLAAHRARQQSLDELVAALAEARPTLAATHAALLAEAEDVLKRADHAIVSKLLPRISEAMAAQRKAMAAAARRNAVLTALAEVGYEVREGLGTAQPADGRMVLRRAASPEMGVELAGGAASERLQFRPVRFAAQGSEGDTTKDRDIETIWCGDFDRLRQRLVALDADMAIERALPVGATPVMVVGQSTAKDSRRDAAPAPTRGRSA